MSTIEGTGTPEAIWLPFLETLGAARLDMDRAPGRAVVVAPHPDDEVLGVGGLLALLAARGTRVDVVAVTDGESSHPGGSVPPHVLAPLRVAETTRALAVLGIHGRVRRLGRPDGGREALELPVVESLRLTPGDWLLGPWSGDGHPDHEAVGRACERVAARDGAFLLAYPVWMWHWSAAGDPAVPWRRALRIDLPLEVRASKARAVTAFASQTCPIGPLPADAPVLSASVLERFARPWEMVFG